MLRLHFSIIAPIRVPSVFKEKLEPVQPIPASVVREFQPPRRPQPPRLQGLQAFILGIRIPHLAQRANTTSLQWGRIVIPAIGIIRLIVPTYRCCAVFTVVLRIRSLAIRAALEHLVFLSVVVVGEEVFQEVVHPQQRIQAVVQGSSVLVVLLD